MNKQALYLILLFAPAPSFGVLVALYNFNGFLGTFLWIVAKLWLFGGIFSYLFLIKKLKFKDFFNHKGIRTGFIIGFLMCLIILGSFLLFKNNLNQNLLQSKAIKAGLTSLNLYLIISLYFSFINSLFEEIIFRYFFYKQSLRLLNNKNLAVFLAALIFTIHHSLILCSFASISIIILGSLGVFIAALIWSFLYSYYNNLYPSYIAHIFADIIIFIIGGILIFGEI